MHYSSNITSTIKYLVRVYTRYIFGVALRINATVSGISVLNYAINDAAGARQSRANRLPSILNVLGTGRNNLYFVNVEKVVFLSG